MAAYPYMVQTALNVLISIFEQWHKEPYRWIKERDLQSEIGSRLNQIFALQGLGTIKGDYKWADSGFDREQSWSRVSYEPYVNYEYEEGKSARCHPDIVIWDDLKEGEDPPGGQLWPILWACELKYRSADDGSTDVAKLENLIKQHKIKFGCSVRVHFVKDPDGVGVKWTGTDHGRHLWACDVAMPEGKKNS
jgi:hypothetical protein